VTSFRHSHLYRHCIFILWLFFVLLIITGCTRRVGIYLQAATDLNNGGNPVVLQIYQLSTDVNFKTETSESFWRTGQHAFTKDIVGKPREIILHPREVLRMDEVQIKDDTKYIGVAADFYKPDKEQWRYLIDVTEKKADELLILVSNNTLVITEVKE